MSSYLNIYLQDKSTKEKKQILSYSRSCSIYTAFNDNINVAYAGEEEKYTELTSYKMVSLLGELNSDKKKSENRLNELEKHAGGNTEIIEEIISWKDYLKEQEDTIAAIGVISDIVNDCTNDYSDFDGVFINID